MIPCQTGKVDVLVPDELRQELSMDTVHHEERLYRLRHNLGSGRQQHWLLECIIRRVWKIWTQAFTDDGVHSEQFHEADGESDLLN